MKDKRVVITGIGPIASTGIGKDAFWKGILEQKAGVGLKELKLDGELWDKFNVHQVDNFDIERFNIEAESIDDLKAWKEGKEDKDLLFLLASVKLALDDSNISYDREDNNIGLFLTVEHPGFEPFCEGLIKETISFLEKHPLNKLELFRHVYKQSAQSGYDLQTFMYLYFVAKVFGFQGYSLFTNNACASGLYALEAAVRQIKCGGSDIVFIAGGDITSTMFKHLWFKEKGLYAEDGRIKPFSKKADGIVLGDGASALVLEELNHAMSRNAHIYAEYSGSGFALEGWKVTYPRIGGTTYQKTIETALKSADLKPTDIDLVNPHGVALKVTDAYEAKAIADVFNSNSERPFITAFKPYVGHNLGGSAILESSILLLSMESNVIPPTLNCEEVEPNYNIKLVREMTPCSLNAVMKLSCGFAGYNAAAVFKRLK